jgi:hypothetical protein
MLREHAAKPGLDLPFRLMAQQPRQGEGVAVVRWLGQIRKAFRYVKDESWPQKC